MNDVSSANICSAETSMLLSSYYSGLKIFPFMTVLSILSLVLV